MSDYFVLKYPTSLPLSGSLGTNADWYDRTMSNAFVGVNYNSAGYPFPTNNILQAKFWNTREDAETYMAMFPYFTIHTVTVKVD